MKDWELQFAMLGQQAIEHLQDNPHQGPEATRRLKSLLGEFKGKNRNNDSEGSLRPTRKDGMNMGAATEATVNVKDAHGKDVAIPLAAFESITAQVGKRRGVKVSNRVAHTTDDEMAEALSEADEADEEETEDEDDHNERVRARFQKMAARQATLKGAVKYHWRYQGKRIAWEWVELAGKAAIVAFVVVGGIWMLSRLMTPEQLDILPKEGGPDAG